MNFGLEKKTVVITAGSKGIGRAIAELFAAEKCNVAICARSEDTLRQTRQSIFELHNQEIIAEVCDIGNAKQLNHFFDRVYEAFVSVDILVNNCGGPRPGFFEDFEDIAWESAYQHVLMSAVRSIRRVLPDMKEKKWGRIINISSVAVKEPIDNLVLSTAFRTGLIGLSKNLSNRVAKHNITVNTIAPGMILTDRLFALADLKAGKENITRDEALSRMCEQIPARRIGNTSDIASLAAFLASDYANYITGTVIPVDGGKIKSL